MKKGALKTMLLTLQVVVACVVLCVLYVVYVPLAIVRAIFDMHGYRDFIYCVRKCTRTMVGWFRKRPKCCVSYGTGDKQ